MRKDPSVIFPLKFDTPYYWDFVMQMDGGIAEYEAITLVVANGLILDIPVCAPA